MTTCHHNQPFNAPASTAAPITQPATTTPPIASSRILRLKQVIALTGLSRSAIYDRLDPRSKRHDPHFPKQVKLGTSSNAAVGWREAEILAWISQCSVVG